MSYLQHILEVSAITGYAFLVRTQTHWPVEWNGEAHRGEFWLNESRITLGSSYDLHLNEILKAPDWVMGRGEYHEVVWRSAEETLLRFDQPYPDSWGHIRSFWDLVKEG